MKNKKITAIIATMVITATMTACGEVGSETSSENIVISTTPTASETTVTTTVTTVPEKETISSDSSVKETTVTEKTTSKTETSKTTTKKTSADKQTSSETKKVTTRQNVVTTAQPAQTYVIYETETITETPEPVVTEAPKTTTKVTTTTTAKPKTTTTTTTTTTAQPAQNTYSDYEKAVINMLTKGQLSEKERKLIVNEVNKQIVNSYGKKYNLTIDTSLDNSLLTESAGEIAWRVPFSTDLIKQEWIEKQVTEKQALDRWYNEYLPSTINDFLTDLSGQTSKIKFSCDVWADGMTDVWEWYGSTGDSYSVTIFWKV